MNILVICHEFPPAGGGAGVGAHDIAAELSKKHTVDVITARQPGLPDREQNGRMTVHRVWTAGRANVEASAGNGAQAAFASFIAAAIIKALMLGFHKRFDVVHSHFCIPAGLAGRIFSALTGIPHVTTIIEADIFDPRTQCIYPYRNRLIRAVICGVINTASSVTAISTYIRRAAERYYGITRDITVIPHGLPGAETPGVRTGSNEGCRMTAIGRLVQRKGYDVLLQALAFTGDKQARLTIMGDGPERGRLAEKSRELGIDSQVTFAGAVSGAEKERLLADSDLFVLATLHEGQGIVFIEAMRFGLPIVTTNEGGQTDFLQDGINALLVAPGNARSLAAALVRIMGDRQLRERMSDANHSAARSFSMAAVAGRYEEIFVKAGRTR